MGGAARAGVCGVSPSLSLVHAALGVVGPVLLAWGATTGAYSVEEQCKLSKEQKEVIETVVGGFGLGCNATLLVTPKVVKIV